MHGDAIQSEGEHKRSTNKAKTPLLQTFKTRNEGDRFQSEEDYPILSKPVESRQLLPQHGSRARCLANVHAFSHKTGATRKEGQDAGGLEKLTVTYGTKEGRTDGYTGNRAPQRVTITLNYAAYRGLERRSTMESRSMSNLAAFILESALIKNP